MTESIQYKLLRVRPPRVRITYDVETGGAIEKRELPFIVGILADLSGKVPDDGPPPTLLRDRKITDIDRDNFDDVMKSIAPRVSLAPILRWDALKDLQASSDPRDKQLILRSMDDLNPLRVVQALPTLAEKYRARRQIRSLQAKAESDNRIGDALDTWVGVKGGAGVATLQTELNEALRGTPTDAVKQAVRGALFSLQDKLLAIQPASTLASTFKAETTAAAAATAAAATAAASAAVAAAAKADLDKANAALAKANAQQKAAAADAQVQAQKKADAASATAAQDQADKNDADAHALAADPVATKKALDDAIAAGQGELGKWSVTGAVTGDTLAYGRMLANALAESDAEDNRFTAAKLLAALADQSQPDATSTDEDHKRYDLRDAALKRLDPSTVAAMVSAVGTLDPAAKPGDPRWARALLLLGLVNPDDPDQIVPAAGADPSATQDAIGQADLRSAAIGFAAYLHDSANGERASVATKVFPVLAALRGDDDSGAATAVALLRLRDFAEQVLGGLQAKRPELLKVVKKGAVAIIDEQVVLIDQYLSAALSAIMHADDFMDIERGWRGLHYLVTKTETSAMLKLRLLNVTKDELREDMEKAVDFDQSVLFKKIYEAEYDTLGGQPYSLLVGGYELGGGSDDLSFLKKIAEVAAAAHAPFIAAASSKLFGLDAYSALDKPRDLAKIFEGAELEGWKEFRDIEDSRYVSLVLPRALLRLPYGSTENKRAATPCDGLNFEEDISTAGAAGQEVFGPDGVTVVSYPPPDACNFVFGNAAYMLAERITNAYSLYSWTAAIRGVEGGGLVQDLPIYTYTSDAGTTEMLCPTEVAITDRREKELNDLGFISLCHYKGAGQAAFFGGQTTNAPKKYFSDSANANARISSMLPYMLAASRFAHYIKVIMRDKIGSFLTRGNIENFLNSWISNYVLLDDNASQEVKASYPLRAASVVVTEVPGQPGVYRATAFIKPHFQLEELTTSIRLVADLPS